MPEHYVTDKQIKDEVDTLLIECLTWARQQGVNDEQAIQALTATRFIYLSKTLFNHGHKYYREQNKTNNPHVMKAEQVEYKYEPR